MTIAKRFFGPVAAIAMVGLGSGCAAPPGQYVAGMPQSCSVNNAATGAVIGAIGGGLLGGFLSNGNPYATVGSALGGAALGGLAGSQIDQQCRQIAFQKAIELAEAERAAAARQRAASQQVAYQSVEYVSPSNGRRHRITPLNSYTDPATKETCSSYSEVSWDANGGGQVSGTGRVCKGANGQVHEA